VTAVLLANAAATLFMAGLAWFVQVVHYPLFGLVGEARFPDYHEAHSTRTTWVVLAPMSVELISSFALIADPPAGETVLTVAGAVLAAATWVATAPAAILHGRIGRSGPRPELLSALIRVSWVRTVIWTGHAVVVVALLAAAIGGT
jgi:hypothetical protein